MTLVSRGKLHQITIIAITDRIGLQVVIGGQHWAVRGDLQGISCHLGVLRLREKCGGNFGKIWWGCAREFWDRGGFPGDLMGIARGFHIIWGDFVENAWCFA